MLIFICLITLLVLSVSVEFFTLIFILLHFGFTALFSRLNFFFLLLHHLRFQMNIFSLFFAWKKFECNRPFHVVFIEAIDAYLSPYLKLNEVHFIPLMISIASFIIHFDTVSTCAIVTHYHKLWPKKEGNKNEQKTRFCHKKRNKKNAWKQNKDITTIRRRRQRNNNNELRVRNYKFICE